jgi:hypothetical protein
MQRLYEKQKAGWPPEVHLTAIERIAHGTEGYAPGNFASEVKVVITHREDPAEDAAAGVRADAVNAAVNAALANRAELESVRHTLWIGRFAYYLYVAALTAGVLAASVPPDSGSKLNPLSVLKNAGILIYDAVVGQWSPLWDAGVRLFSEPGLMLTLLCAFAVSGLLGYYVAHARSRCFSRFWHKSRHDLREALKDARASLQASPPLPPSGRATGQSAD